MKLRPFLQFVVPCFALVAPFLGRVAAPGMYDGSAPAPAPQEADDDFEPEDWVEVLSHTFDDARVRTPENQGAMGTSSLTARLGKVEAALLVDRRHGNQVSIFLGWGPPRKYLSGIEDDLRVRFVLQDGTERVTEMYAGGGTAIQFCSPFDIDLADLESFDLLHRKKARWLKGK